MQIVRNGNDESGTKVYKTLFAYGGFELAYGLKLLLSRRWILGGSTFFVMQTWSPLLMAIILSKKTLDFWRLNLKLVRVASGADDVADNGPVIQVGLPDVSYDESASRSGEDLERSNV